MLKAYTYFNSILTKPFEAVIIIYVYRQSKKFQSLCNLCSVTQPIIGIKRTECSSVSRTYPQSAHFLPS